MKIFVLYDVVRESYDWDSIAACVTSQEYIRRVVPYAVQKAPLRDLRVMELFEVVSFRKIPDFVDSRYQVDFPVFSIDSSKNDDECYHPWTEYHFPVTKADSYDALFRNESDRKAFEKDMKAAAENKALQERIQVEGEPTRVPVSKVSDKSRKAVFGDKE